MASQSDVIIIVDDTSSTFKFDASLWSVIRGRWYGNTSMYASKASVASGTPASFEMSFYGTSIAFCGASPAIDNSPSFSVAIDSQQSTSLTYSEMAIDTQWYTSQTLSDQLHQITVSDLDRVVLDYAIVTPGDQTPLQGTTIAVDDMSPEIVYHGNWKQEAGQSFNTASTLFVRPLRNTTHTSTAEGDSFVFQFAGTSVSVYGFLPLQVSGSFSVTYTVDNTPTSLVFPSPNSQFDAKRVTQPHFPFFQSPTLVGGNHTLVVNVTGIVGQQSFVVDHLTYTPSFDRLSQKPDFSSANSQPGLTSPTSTQETPAGQTQTPTESTKTKSNTGAIAGGVVGGIIVLIAIFATMFFCIRKYRKAGQGNALMAEPFTSPITATPSEFSHQHPPPNMPSSSDQTPLSTTRKTSSALDTRSPTSGAGSSSLSSMRQTEVQQRLDQITLLTSRLEEARSTRHGSVDVDALYEEIDRLKKENEMLMKGYMPPPSYEATKHRSVSHPS